MKLEFSQQIFEKSSNVKFHQNPSSESRVVPCGRTDGQLNITKLTVTSRNFENTPRMVQDISDMLKETYAQFQNSAGSPSSQRNTSQQWMTTVT